MLIIIFIFLLFNFRHLLISLKNFKFRTKLYELNTSYCILTHYFNTLKTSLIICDNNPSSLPYYIGSLLAYLHTLLHFIRQKHRIAYRSSDTPWHFRLYLLALTFPLPVINILLFFVLWNQSDVTFTMQIEGRYFHKYSRQSWESFLCFILDIFVYFLFCMSFLKSIIFY